MIHLRIRTEYSYKTTFAPVKRVVQRLKEIKCERAAIVDVAGTWGHVWFHQECLAQGVKPILGIELIVSEKDDFTPHMWFLARNAAGLRELYQFSSKAWRQKIKTKRGSRARLFPADVIAMSDNVYRFAGDILEEDFLVEAKAILDLNPASRVLNLSKKRLAEKTGLRLVTTADNSYSFKEDRENFELIESSVTKPTPQWITEDVDHGGLEFEDYPLPKAPMIKKEGDLEKLCREGIEYRRLHNGLEWTDKYEARLHREINLIRAKGFDSYFIVVADMCIEAKKHMLVGPSRGSSAGSLVCYLTRITEIDPVSAGLYFERFIDESRKDLPDIDIDFPGLKRHLVFEYMRKVYTHVANIGTVQRFKAKSSMIQVCKKLGIPPIATYATKAAIITRTSGDARGSDSIEETLKNTKAGQDLVKLYPDITRAIALDQHASHTGTHAAGLLVCNDALENYCTVQDDGTAHVEKKTCEALNLLKVDILGLRTLDILEDSGIDPGWYSLRLDDPETYKVFNSQALSGIFQFEGQSMRNLSSQIEFKSIHDIDSVTALARPGPFGGGVTATWLERRHGKAYEAFHPVVEPYMRDTYGLPVYQEQTMAIVREIGKFDWTKVSSIRKAVSLKKGKEFFDTYFPEFKAGAHEHGMDETEARKIWDFINSMGAYQMNKAHTYSYAVIGYWTAWLKAHHPAEFAAANLRHAKDEESALTMLQEMVREGRLKYKPFDIEESGISWSVKDGVLLAGFDCLKGFGAAKSKKFIEARDAGGFTESQVEQIKKATSVFTELFPIRKAFSGYYNHPEEYNLQEAPIQIADIKDDHPGGSYVILGRLIQKNLRDQNEEVNVKKRGGRKLTGPIIFIDFRVADDSGRIQVRIDRYKYERIGKPIFEAPLGTILLIRAHFRAGIRFGFVQKVKILDKPEEPVILPDRIRQGRFEFEEEQDATD